jgi:hypothetical protein
MNTSMHVHHEVARVRVRALARARGEMRVVVRAVVLAVAVARAVAVAVMFAVMVAVTVSVVVAVVVTVAIAVLPRCRRRQHCAAAKLPPPPPPRLLAFYLLLSMAETEFRYLKFESKGGQDHKFSHKSAGHNDPTKIFFSPKIPSLSLREEVSEFPSPPSTPCSCVELP